MASASADASAAAAASLALTLPRPKICFLVLPVAKTRSCSARSPSLPADAKIASGFLTWAFSLELSFA